MTTFLSTLPYHRDRTPEGFESGQLALNGDSSACLRSFRQAVEESITLRGYLKEYLGYNQVGIGGISLGGIIGSVAAFLETFDFNVQAYCSGFLSEIIWTSKMLSYIRKALVARGIDKGRLQKQWAVIDPVSFARSAKTRRLMIILGKYDGLVSNEVAESYLRQLRTNPELQIRVDMLNHSHYTGVLSVGSLSGRVGNYIFDRSTSLQEQQEVHALCP